MGGKEVRAFVPDALPPSPPIALDGPLQQALEDATLAIGRLDGAAMQLPDPGVFVDTCVRKEAVLSSQIEGVEASLSDLLLYEVDGTPAAPLAAAEAAGCVAALQHGLSRLEEGIPLSNRLLREMHAVLFAHDRNAQCSPGEFRRVQVRGGGPNPATARHVPTPPAAVPDCMGALESFLSARSWGLPVLVRAGLAHAQFEAIHPFVEGNGRIGRLLVTLVLCQAGVLRQPLLYLSRHFLRRRGDYYDLLNAAQGSGDWEAWLAYFVDGVRETAEHATEASRRLSEVFANDGAAIERDAGRRAASALRLHEALKECPILSITEASNRTGLSFPAVSSAMMVLEQHGIAREITGHARARIFAYERHLNAVEN